MSPSSTKFFPLIIIMCGLWVVDRPAAAQSATLSTSPHITHHLALENRVDRSDRWLGASEGDREGLPRRRADGGSR
ncbi:MAG TPA: hypothetical protein V6C64_15005 [Microcoleaceae cyanobacterium]|jgi:hypothetical protein